MNSVSQATLTRLGSVRVAVSHTFLYKKMDELGRNHLQDMHCKIQAEGKILQDSSTPNINSPLCKDMGRKLVIDNFNYSSQPHEMTEDHQNKVVNWVGLMVVENRLSGQGLGMIKPSPENLISMESCLLLPSKIERANQRRDYIVLCGWLAVKYFKCLEPRKNAAVQHQPHRYLSEMGKPSKPVSFPLD